MVKTNDNTWSIYFCERSSPIYNLDEHLSTKVCEKFFSEIMCDATSCTECIDQTDLGGWNFESCEWDNSNEYCYNWYDNPNGGGTSSKIGCPSVYTPIIIAVVVVVLICCIGFCVCASRSRSKRSNARSAVNMTSPTPQPIPVPQPQRVIQYVPAQQIQPPQQQIIYVDQNGNQIQPQAIQGMQQPMVQPGEGNNSHDAPPSYADINASAPPAYTSQ